MGRSFRVSRLDRLVRRGEPLFHLEAQVRSRGVSHRLEVTAGQGERGRQLDGKAAGLADTLNSFACLVFASPRLDLFRGSPQDRRRFLDRGVASIWPDLLPVYRDQVRAGRQKNELLRRARESGGGTQVRDQIQAFNRRLAQSGSRIQQARQRYVDLLHVELVESDALGGLVPGSIPRLAYRPSPRLNWSPMEGVNEIAAALCAAFDERMDEEMRRGVALLGPQRDTLSITQDGCEMATYASSGQQRAALIALKICKMLVHKKLTGDYPVLLVDDVDSELDAERTRRALRILNGEFQAIVASARGAAWPESRPGSRLIRVRNGIITLA